MSTVDARSCTSAERYRPIPASRRLPEQRSSVGAALRAVRVTFWALRSAYTEYTAVGLAGLAFTCVTWAWRGIITDAGERSDERDKWRITGGTGEWMHE